MEDEVMRDAEQTLEPDTSQTPLVTREEPPAKVPGPHRSSCLACDRPDYWDNMISCDGPHEEQWYHLRCVGMQGLRSDGTIKSNPRLDIVLLLI